MRVSRVAVTRVGLMSARCVPAVAVLGLVIVGYGCARGTYERGAFVEIARSTGGRIIWYGHELGGIVRFGHLEADSRRHLFLLPDSIDGRPSTRPLPAVVPRGPRPEVAPKIRAMTKLHLRVWARAQLAADRQFHWYRPGNQTERVEALAECLRRESTYVESVTVHGLTIDYCWRGVDPPFRHDRYSLMAGPRPRWWRPRPRPTTLPDHARGLVDALDRGDLVILDRGRAVVPGSASPRVLRQLRALRAGQSAELPEARWLTSASPHLFAPLPMEPTLVDSF